VTSARTGRKRWITSRVTDLRVRETDERTGLDLALHNEQIGH
jgi:Amt family ammonium transporter